MFTNQPFTENKPAINVKTVQIRCSISQPRLFLSKSPSVTRCSICCRLTNFSLNLKNPNSKSKRWIVVMLPITVTCCRNIHILIRSPLRMKFLHLLWKFMVISSMIFEKNEFENCHLKYSRSILNLQILLCN